MPPQASFGIHSLISPHLNVVMYVTWLLLTVIEKAVSPNGIFIVGTLDYSRAGQAVL